MNISNQSATQLPKQSLPANTEQPLLAHRTERAKVSLSSVDLSAESREKMVTYVAHKQQQALVETAQNAFTENQESTDALITGEIAAQAAKQHTKHTLVFAAIEKIQTQQEQKPSIQTSA